MSTSTVAVSDAPKPARLLEIVAAHAGPDGWWEFSYEILADGSAADARRLEAELADLEGLGRIEIDRCRVRLADPPPRHA